MSDKEEKIMPMWLCRPGPDKGVDILASVGTLGFGSSKICVQVKSTDMSVDRIVLDSVYTS